MRGVSWREGMALVAAVAMACASGIAYAFTTFATKGEVVRDREGVERRLDRMDEKLDRVIEALRQRR